MTNVYVYKYRCHSIYASSKERHLKKKKEEIKREIDSSKNIVDGIVAYAEEYVIGFLNAVIEGELYLGIDDSGIIVGINLNRNDRDNLSQKISNN